MPLAMFPVIRSSARRGSCDAAGQGVGGGNFGRLYRGSRKKKNGLFTVMLTVRVYPPAPPYGQAVVIFSK